MNRINNNKDKYLLSVVLCGRNDNYLGDFKYRITTAVNYLCESAKKNRRLNDIEVIIVDWNSETPLCEELCLTPDACKAAKFITVPPDVASLYNTDGQAINASCAINTGIIRSNGKYVLLTPADSLITSTSLQNLLFLLEGKLNAVFDPQKTLLNIGRKEIPWQIAEKKPGLDEWDRYLQLHSRHLFYNNSFHSLCGGYGALVLNRSLWHQVRGLAEEEYGWGWSDVELGLRINLAYPSVDLSYYGILVYDLQQKPTLLRTRKLATNEKIPRNIWVNDENWGLKEHTLEVRRSHCVLNHAHQTDRQKEPLYKRSDIINELKEVNYKDILQGLHGAFVKGNEWACLYPLAWFSSKYVPKKYLEYGITKGHTYLVASSLIDSLEIYSIDPFEAPDAQANLLPDLKLSKLNHKGYVHYLAGDVNTALDRLKKLFIGSISFGLILFRVDMYGDEALNQLKDVMKFLEDNGALIVTGKDKQLFVNVWEAHKKEFPEHLHISCKKYCTGLTLKGRAEVDTSLPGYEYEEKVLSRAWKPIRCRIYLAYLFCLFLKLAKKHVSKKRWIT